MCQYFFLKLYLFLGLHILGAFLAFMFYPRFLVLSVFAIIMNFVVLMFDRVEQTKCGAKHPGSLLVGLFTVLLAIMVLFYYIAELNTELSLYWYVGLVGVSFFVAPLVCGALFGKQRDWVAAFFNMCSGVFLANIWLYVSGELNGFAPTGALSVVVPLLLSVALTWSLLRQARWFTYLAAVFLLFAASFGVSHELLMGRYWVGVGLVHCAAWLISVEIHFPPANQQVQVVE